MHARACILGRVQQYRGLQFAFLWAFLAIVPGQVQANPVPKDPVPNHSAPANPALAGYSNYEAFAQQVAEFEKSSELVSVRSLGTTLGERQVLLITLSAGDKSPEEKPALLILGSTQASHLAGSELALRSAQQLVAAAETDPAVKTLLETYTWYFIPRPSPDASEKNFTGPFRQQDGNLLKTDDDRDFAFGEDPHNDLNGDGWITQMRVEDPAGDYLPHPDDARILIKADRLKGERGRYRLLSEGIDDDQDEAFNEDPGDGVDLNKNFTFDYQFFTPGSGPHQVSEVESRAIADFCFSRPNIATVFTFAPQDNLLHPWKSGGENDAIKTKLLKKDAPYTDHIASRYQHLLDLKDAPASASSHGALLHWAYFHYGRWAFATRGWSIPKVEVSKAEAPKAEVASKTEVPQPESAAKPEPDEKTAPKTDEKTPAASEVSASQTPTTEVDKDSPKAPQADAGKVAEKATKLAEATKPAAQKIVAAKKSDETRGADQLNQLRWLEQQGITDGFVDWTEIKHPDFPHQKVEVGGLKPFYDLNPPAELLDSLAEKHTAFFRELAQLLPVVELHRVEAQPLGGGIVRIRVAAVNQGRLPTSSDMGRLNTYAYPLQLELKLPKQVQLLQGSARVRVPVLAPGETYEHFWLVRINAADSTAIESTGEESKKTPPLEAAIQLTAPAVIGAQATVKLP